jgi:hypothetical protein
VLEAPARGELGELPRREGDRILSVLAAVEAFLFGSSDADAVHDEGRRRVVKDRVDAENPHDSGTGSQSAAPETPKRPFVRKFTRPGVLRRYSCARSAAALTPSAHVGKA